MADHRALVFPPGQPPERIDRFLARTLPELSRSQLKKLIDDGQVIIDGSTIKAGTKLKGGETLSVTLPEPVPTQTLPQAIPLTILYEDPVLIVIDKPAGLVVHPAAGHGDGTLVNALLHHCDDLSGVGGELRPGIVHRLDKDTSGVLVAAKNDAAHQSLAQQFSEHRVNRRYQALIHGILPTPRGTIDQPIGRHPTQRKKMSGKGRGGRRAVTHWKVLRSYEDDRLSLVELRLETGRTHQIRVHLAEYNHPLVGDQTYGRDPRKCVKDEHLCALIRALGRQALHARLLGFSHPLTGEYCEFTSPLPTDMARLVDYLDEKYGTAEPVSPCPDEKE
ncbi:MAG: RluA family pseudouridine synthase [Desulfuromonadaceae bacterium]|nr:RluA family pseudouridine synthase [Desulfuromonadaceae bacterium]